MERVNLTAEKEVFLMSHVAEMNTNNKIDKIIQFFLKKTNLKITA